MTATDLARRVGEAMWAHDTASKDTMGMELVACEPGRAVLRMAVTGAASAANPSQF